MIYCMSDIHGDYKKYKEMLEKINLSDEDTLYIIGDVVDRGSESMRILKDMMIRPNVIPIVGNHEYMALQCLSFLINEVNDDSIKMLENGLLQGLIEWQKDGGVETIEEFRSLTLEDREDILDYLNDFLIYDEVNVNGSEYLLVHAGIDNFIPGKPIEEYQISDLIFARPDYSRVYFADKYMVTGHTPTRNIKENPKPDMIYKANNHIAIDCGCGYGAKLGCICLDTGEEFYL